MVVDASRAEYGCGDIELRIDRDGEACKDTDIARISTLERLFHNPEKRCLRRAIERKRSVV
jgi:hypothetical protein